MHGRFLAFIYTQVIGRPGSLSITIWKEAVVCELGLCAESSELWFQFSAVVRSRGTVTPPAQTPWSVQGA